MSEIKFVFQAVLKKKFNITVKESGNPEKGNEHNTLKRLLREF